jgi:hypothetical protein
MLTKVAENHIALPDLRKFPYKNCDLFFVGKSKTVSKITSLYKELNEIYEFKNFLSGEELLQIYALKKDILLFDFKTSGILMRENKIKTLNFGKIHFTDNPFFWFKLKIQQLTKFRFLSA